MKPGLCLLHPCQCALILILLPILVGSFVDQSEPYQEYPADLTMDEEEYEEENLEEEGYQETSVFLEDIVSSRVRRDLRDPTDTDTSGSVDNEDIINNITEHKVR